MSPSYCLILAFRLARDISVKWSAKFLRESELVKSAFYVFLLGGNPMSISREN